MDAGVYLLQFKLGMAYILREDQLRLRVKPVLLVVLLNVIDDGDAGKHALNVMLGIEHLRDNISQKPVPLRPGEVPVEA